MSIFFGMVGTQWRETAVWLNFHWQQRALDTPQCREKYAVMADLRDDALLERSNAEELRGYIREGRSEVGALLALIGEGAGLLEELQAAKRIPHGAEPAITSWLERARALAGEPKVIESSEDNGHL